MEVISSLKKRQYTRQSYQNLSEKKSENIIMKDILISQKTQKKLFVFRKLCHEKQNNN